MEGRGRGPVRCNGWPHLARLRGEEFHEVAADDLAQAGAHRAHRGVGPHLRRVEEQPLTPDQPGVDAELDNAVEEAPEDVEPIPLADLREAGVVGQALAQVVAKVPAQAQAVGSDAHELPLGADALEEHDELELEEDDRVVADRRYDTGVGQG